MTLPLLFAIARRKRRAQTRRARLSVWLDARAGDGVPPLVASHRLALALAVAVAAAPSLAFAWGRGVVAVAVAAGFIALAFFVAALTGRKIDEAVASLVAAADVDAVTGARSRNWAERHLRRALARVELRSPRPVVALIDLDRFKDVNDTFGHVAGDRALRAVAALLDDALRAEDWAARYGGDEFVVVLNARVDYALGALDRVRTQVAELDLPGVPRGLSVSVGAALARPGDELETLMERADSALYAVKANGGDGVKVSAAPD